MFIRTTGTSKLKKASPPRSLGIGKTTDRVIKRFLIIAVVSVTGIFAGALGSSVRADDISQEETIKYANALLQIEPLRQRAYNQIKQVIGGPPPNIVCHQADSYSNLPGKAKEIAADFCKDSKEIVQKSGLKVSEFNEITMKAQSDPNLQRHLQNILLKLQR